MHYISNVLAEVLRKIDDYWKNHQSDECLKELKIVFSNLKLIFNTCLREAIVKGATQEHPDSGLEFYFWFPASLTEACGELMFKISREALGSMITVSFLDNKDRFVKQKKAANWVGCLIFRALPRSLLLCLWFLILVHLQKFS
jgi:hypothetical protein